MIFHDHTIAFTYRFKEIIYNNNSYPIKDNVITRKLSIILICCFKTMANQRLFLIYKSLKVSKMVPTFGFMDPTYGSGDFCLSGLLSALSRPDGASFFNFLSTELLRGGEESPFIKRLRAFAGEERS